METFTLFTDGASKGNPGRASIGAVIQDSEGTVIVEVSEAIGIATNNEAEYRALIRGLESAMAYNIRRLEWTTDSELVARQWTGQYQVKAPHLQPLLEQAKALAAQFDRFSIKHVLRHHNQLADKLANQALKSKPRLNRGGN